MTLILGMSKAEGIYLSADYRVTDLMTGKLIDDASVKFLRVDYPPDKGGPKVLMAYTRIVGELARWIRAQRRKGVTLQAICDQLNEQGVPTANGGRLWRPTSLRTVLRGVEPRRATVEPLP